MESDSKPLLSSTDSSIHKAGSGGTGLGLGRGGAPSTGQTGFGVWSVGFVLGATAKVVIHLHHRISRYVTVYIHKQNI